MNEQNIIEDWLKSLHLGHYAQSFIDNGYDDLEICKQIGEPDLDAIGVDDADHRQHILRAVRVLLEHGGTAVYFTLEENTKRLGDEPNEGQAHRKDKETMRLLHSPLKKYVDEYEEGKAEFVRFPKMQLKMIVRDKLVRDGIRLSAQPYTNPDGSRGHLESLATVYAEELRTHYRDVLDRMEELRRRRVAIDFPPLPLDSDNLGLQPPANLKPGKYSPSSCLSDQEEETVYGLYQCPYLPMSSRTTQRCLSPRSRYFYEPCPFPAAGGSKEETPSSEHPKKRGGFGKLFRSLGSKKDKSSCKAGKPHLLQLTQKPPIKVPRLPPGDVLLGDEERLQLMLLVRDGFLTMEQAVQKIRHREAERAAKEKGYPHPPVRNEVFSEFGKRVFWSPPGAKRRHPRSTAVFYPEMTTTCVGNHIYYEPPDDLDWDFDEAKPSTEARSDLRPYTPEEFTSAILARSCPACEGEGVVPPTTATTCQNPSPACCSTCVQEVKQPIDCDYASSPVMGRRCKPVLGPAKNRTSRTSYSTSEEGQSQSSDYEEQEEGENKSDLQCSREMQNRSTTWAGRVRDLHRDVKKRFSRLRSTRSSNPDNEMGRDSTETHEAIIRPGSSVESIPSGSGSRSSLQAPTPTSSNRSSTSAGEDEGPPVVGTFIGRARAIVDYTPSPYDKDALAFKKGDIIDIIAKHKTGIWMGMAHSRVGHFKFINVEEVPGERRVRQRRSHSAGRPIITSRPDSLQDLLKKLGLLDYMNVFVLNGYEDLDALKEIEKEDLDNLGIQDAEHCQKLLRAIELLQEYDGDIQTHDTEYSEDCQKSSPRDSGCYASNENLAHKESALPQNWLVSADNEENEVSQSESGIQSSEGPDSSATINNLDVNSIPADNTQSVPPSTETSNVNEHTAEGVLPRYNIPPYHSSDVCSVTPQNQATTLQGDIDEQQYLHDIQINKENPYEQQRHSLPSAESFKPSSDRNSETILSDHSAANNKSKCVCSEPTCRISHLSHQPCGNSTLSSHSDNVESIYGEMCYNQFRESTIYLHSQQQCSPDSVPKASKSASLPRHKSHSSKEHSSNSSAMQKHSFFEGKKTKKSNQHKASLQPVSRYPCPPLLSLLVSVTDKLEEECIDLCEEPYTDKMGFCGIPPALVQRYADELHQDVYDVAQALDQIRVNTLQMRGHRAVPNDFLGDSCSGPILEANYSSVKDWLISLGLPMYDNLLKSAGYNHLSQVAAIRNTDLKDCGIANAQHIRLLTSAISVLHLHANPTNSRFGSNN